MKKSCRRGFKYDLNREEKGNRRKSYKCLLHKKDIVPTGKTFILYVSIDLNKGLVEINSILFNRLIPFT